MRKFKCFACHKFGHFSYQFPTMKKGKGKETTIATAKMEELAEKFEKNFTLVSCILEPSEEVFGLWTMEHLIT